MSGSYLSRSWEVSSVPVRVLPGGTGKGNRNPVIYAGEKSDISIVPKKLPNKGYSCYPAEAMEGRGIAAGNGWREARMPDTVPGKCVDGTRRHT